MEQQGLAQGLAQGGQPIDPAREMIEHIKEALLAGMTPEELIAKGAPQEAVAVAIQELQAEMAQQAQPAPQGPGLAADQGIVG